MSVGVALGPTVPNVPATQILPISVFLMLLGPKLVAAPAVVAAATSVAVTVGIPVPGPTRVLTGLLFGAFAGWEAERLHR